MQEHQISSSAGSKRSLWIAVGALSVAVAGLGGTLIGTQIAGGSPAPTAQESAASGFVPFGDASPAPRASAEPAAQAAPVVRAPSAAPAAMVRAAPPACEACGTVLSVQAVQRAAPASGAGAVAGGVVGGLLGNQIGGGSGRAVATVIGAVGGGWAGHEVEKNVRQTTRYQVRVRMDDGSVRTLEQGQALAVGTPVLVQAGVAQARPLTTVRG